nr:DUF1517 domain-containing protein [Meiothermus rufus]
MLIKMHLLRVGLLVLLWVMAPLPWMSPGWNSALAQRSGGGVGGRGGFSSPTLPRVNPSPAPSFPLPTPRSYPTYPSPGPPVYIRPVGGSGLDLMALIFIVGIVLVSLSMIRGLQRAGSSSEPESTVARLRLALLHSPQLQSDLRALADMADTESARGLADLIDNAAVRLLREQAAWRFGQYQVWTGSLQKAEGQFDAWMTETRSEYIETYRHFEGKRTAQANYQPKAEPDGRYLLVTLLLAVHGNLPPVPTPLRREGARQALLALATSSPVNTLAAYLAWTPEAPGEALSEADLLAGWPALELL